MNITIVKRPQEDPAMTRSRIIIALSAGLMSLSLAGAPAAHADDLKKDTMSKDEMKKDDGMKKDTMSKDSMKKDDGMKKDDAMSKDKMGH